MRPPLILVPGGLELEGEEGCRVRARRVLRAYSAPHVPPPGLLLSFSLSLSPPHPAL
jgi:hypothetical protein